MRGHLPVIACNEPTFIYTEMWMDRNYNHCVIVVK